MLLVSSVRHATSTRPLHAAMAALGDSVAVVGGDGTWHVHVHTDDPAAAIAAAGVGRREQVLVRLVAAAHASSAHDDDRPLRRRGVHELARSWPPGTRPPARSRWCAARRRPSARTTWSGR